MTLSARTATLPGVHSRRTGTRGLSLPISGNWWIFVVFSIGLVLVAGPFVWMVLSSFKSSPELHAFPPTLFPVQPTLENYTTLLAKYFEEAYGHHIFLSPSVTAADGDTEQDHHGSGRANNLIMQPSQTNPAVRVGVRIIVRQSLCDRIHL